MFKIRYGVKKSKKYLFRLDQIDHLGSKCVCILSTVSSLHSHHEQYSWYDEAWVGCITEDCPHEGWQVQVDRLHDHIKHFRLPAANISTVNMCLHLHMLTSNYAPIT